MLDFNTIEKLDRIATPFYYYDMDLFHKTVDHVADLAAQHDIKVHYAIKANTERRLLEYISSQGCGADCVSGNEVLHAHDCGFLAGKIVYAGVGKSDKEIYNASCLTSRRSTANPSRRSTSSTRWRTDTAARPMYRSASTRT